MTARPGAGGGVRMRRELALLRLAAQHLVGPGLGTCRDAVAHLLAVQAQDYAAALLAVALRTAGRDRGAVAAALDAGELVRSWPMRGTLHLVPAADLRWLLDLTGERQLRASARRRAELGLDEATLGRAREVAETVLAGGGLPRAGLLAAWTAAGIAVTGQRGPHLLAHLAHTGVVCLGPTSGGDPQRVVLLDDHVPRRRLDRDEALGALARRYFTGHGPATVHDLARWAGLPLRDVRAGVAVTGDALERLVVDGTEHLMSPATPERLREHRRAAQGVVLLPAFDEFVLGYVDRTAQLPAVHADQVEPGGNGVFRPVVVARGIVVATWRRGARGGEPVVIPFTELTKTVAAALPRAFARLPG